MIPEGEHSIGRFDLCLFYGALTFQRLIGRLLGLLNAPESIVIDVSIKIAKVWRFKGCRRQKRAFPNDADQEYLSGVTLGYEDTRRDLQATTTKMVSNSQDTQQVLAQDDGIDGFNPFDADLDGAASDVSQSANMKVEPWLASLQDAAKEGQEDEMDIDRLDETDQGVGRRAWGTEGRGNGQQGPEQSSPLERMAARKGLKFHKPSKWLSGRD